MKVGELIIALQAMPQDAVVQTVNGDCCGCGWGDEIHVKLDPRNGEVQVVGSYSTEMPKAAES